MIDAVLAVNRGVVVVIRLGNESHFGYCIMVGIIDGCGSGGGGAGSRHGGAIIGVDAGRIAVTRSRGDG